MSDDLPLIPDKTGAACGDVRPILREVFRDCDSLPPLAPAPRRDLLVPDRTGDHDTMPALHHWIDKYESDRKEIWCREGELKLQYAERLSRGALPNIYKLRPSPAMPFQPPQLAAWRREMGILERRDLIPSVIQNSDVEETLWVRNILNRSSSNFTPFTEQGTKMESSCDVVTPRENTLHSVSIGSVSPRPRPPPPLPPPPPAAAVCVLCLPPRLHFVNFTVGRLHSQCIRLLNVSKSEVRLSVRPPDSAELKIELLGTRGLTVTSGSVTKFRIHFRPVNVRALQDALVVRVCSGQVINIPICCYIQPPLLDILVPAVSSSIFSCSPGDENSDMTLSADCLELGARLLGDVHRVSIMFHCEAEHAAFFLLTEDAWLSFSLDVVTSVGSLLAPPFAVWPAWWQGGGSVRGCVWCRGRCVGLQEAALRVVASTGVVRPLHLIADSVHFRPEHLTLEAHEKNYDICSADDPACERYVTLGTGFPHRALAATVRLVNHSPVSYSYYWSVRPWGVRSCSCRNERSCDENHTKKNEQAEQNERGNKNNTTSHEKSDGVDKYTINALCPGAQGARDNDWLNGVPAPAAGESTSASYLRVEPTRGSIAPRSSCEVHVCAPDVGEELGVRRAVLMLILTDIPKESLSEDYDTMILKTNVIDSGPLPGVEHWSRETCEILHSQMEVWWEVAPVRFVIDPPLLHLDYSRRISSLELPVRVTQLFGSDCISCGWRLPSHVVPPPPLQLTLAPAHSCAAALRYSLPILPDPVGCTEVDVLTLEAAESEWQASSEVRRRAAARHPALRPARCWLGVVPPGVHLEVGLQLFNDTYQHIRWSATPFRWYGENRGGATCGPEPGDAACDKCRAPACTCDIIRPARGALRPGDGAEILYSVRAPQVDGCVCTLVAGGRGGSAGSAGRASLVAYRVLAPRLVLRVLSCCGDKHADCEGCSVDGGEAMLRPRAALSLGRRTCYRVRVTNLTPQPTTVTWDPPLEEDVLKVVFIPKQFDVGSYATVTIQVVLEARAVCPRRVFPRRARVARARRPLYLLIDAAISGLEIECELPLGGAETTDTTVVMRRTQAEACPRGADEVLQLPDTFHEIFAEEDRKRAARAENICRCKSVKQWIPPPAPPADDPDCPPIEIVWEAPRATRACPCAAHPAPRLPDCTEGYCLQFHRLPLATVRSRTIMIRNRSAQSSAWGAAVRSWPLTLHGDEWRTGAGASAGVAIQCTPSGGVLPSRACLALTVHVYADCWGLYRDQLAIKMESLEAIVVDVWVEAVGAPLQLARAPAPAPHRPGDGGGGVPLRCWVSREDPTRLLRVKNVSRAHLHVQAYTVTQHDEPQGALPFRVYVRLFDVTAATATCPCLNAAASSDEELESTSHEPEMDTGVELYLAPDCGFHSDKYFKVTPETASVPPGEWVTWAVTLHSQHHGEEAPPSALMLRSIPVDKSGGGWYRREPPAQVVMLRQATRAGDLRVRVSCCEVRVAVNALDLPREDVMRVRKRFLIQNVGNGTLEMCARAQDPWSIILEHEHACGAGGAAAVAAAVAAAPLTLGPRSSLEMCVEVRVDTEEVCPPSPSEAASCAPAPSPAPSPAPAPHSSPVYEPLRVSTTELHFYADDNILMTLPLVLEVEYPVLSMEPAAIDFGFVSDGDARDSYYTIGHSSCTATLELMTWWEGAEGFSTWPRRLAVAPGRRELIFIQYTSKWCGAPVPVEGSCEVRAVRGGGGGAAGAWCRARGRARAAPVRHLVSEQRRSHALC